MGHLTIRRVMTLKRRILTSILGSLVLCALVGGVFALIMIRFQNALHAGTQYVQGQRAASEAVATCFTELQYIAMRHLRDYDDRIADEFVNKTEACSVEIRTHVQEGYITNEEATKSIAVIHKFKKEVLEISGQLRTAAASLLRVNNKIEELSSILPTTGKKAVDVRPLARIGLMLSASAVGHTTLQKETVTAATDAVRPAMKYLNTKQREDVEDLLLDVSVAANTWNKSLGNRESALVDSGKSFASIPVGFINRALERMTEELNAPLKIARLSLYGSLSIIPLIALLALLLTSWILKSWTRTMGALKDMGQSILEGKGDSEAFANELQSEARASRGDEVSVALTAMVQTFQELEVLKRSLEQKVESRTKDLKNTQAALFQSEKLAGLGTLAAGVAHELNNPLQVIRLAIDGVESADSLEEKHVYVNQCVKHIDRMSRIIAQLRRIARKSDGIHEWASLKGMYDNAMTLMEGRIGNAKIELVADLPDNLEFKCEIMQFESLLSNLLSNAVDALLKRKDPLIPNRIEIKGQRSGKDLILTVKDNGVGIPENIKNRIFEPFFTSKEVGKGMGLGLSLCHTIAKDHQIEMTLDSKEGVGTTFKLKLPAKRLKQGTGASVPQSA